MTQSIEWRETSSQIPTMTLCATAPETATINDVISKCGVMRFDAPIPPPSPPCAVLLVVWGEVGSAVVRVELTSQGSDGRGDVSELSDMKSETVVVHTTRKVCTKVALKER